MNEATITLETVSMEIEFNIKNFERVKEALGYNRNKLKFLLENGKLKIEGWIK